MANGVAHPPPLAGAEIHGFHTAADLNVNKLMGDASTRWFRPNEVHATLSNYTCLKIEPQPVYMPPSGTVLLFDRKVLRNFRKDGHNWKKKKDGKTVQEAHEKLKIGSEERIHVYYARSEDDPYFFRRCYWLLDKNLERIVLVHYRQTSEDNVVDYNPTSGQSPNSLSLEKKAHHDYTVTPLNSNSCSTHSEMSSSLALSEEINSGEDCAIYPGPEIHLAQEYAELQNHDKNLHDINTLNWEDLVGESACMDSVTRQEGDSFSCGKQMRYELDTSMSNGIILPSEGTSFLRGSDALNVDTGFNYSNQMSAGFLQTVKDHEIPSMMFESMNQDSQTTDLHSNPLFTNGVVGIPNDQFASQNSFGRMNYMADDPPGSLDDLWHSTPIMNDNNPDTPATNDYSSAEQVFSITDISPSWAYCTEDTKVLVIGHFNERHQHLEGSNIYCAFGGIYVPAEVIQPGVYRCTASPQAASLVNFYLTFDGHTPISQVLSFEFRSIPHFKLNAGVTSSELNTVKFKWEDAQAQIKLAHLLFSTTDSISILSSRIQSKSLKDAKEFASLTSPLLEKDWMSMLDSRRTNKVSSLPNSQDLFELILKNKLQEWILEKVAEGCKTTPRDKHGQGVIHLCATLDYTWSVPLFSLSGLSLDFRDSNGWTALHWAAYCGREKMVAALLSAGANPSLVTDPTSELPGGCTASDLASRQGYEGLAVYLAEKGLTAHFRAMSLSGNVSASIQTKSHNLENHEFLYFQNLSEQELCLKESLAAYRNAADAADRIQAAFRDRSLKLQTRAVQLAQPEMEAKHIIAAMRIQNAFRHHTTRKMMKAIARIQSHYRTWQTRKNFLHVRRQAIKIQAAFRGHQVRKQYRKITWSVGVLEKALLRWRLKRKGLRGIQVTEVMHVETRQEGTLEEDFFQISREQAEERVHRSVVRVQAMFRSYRAQQEYRRMKEAHEQAKVEYNLLMGSSNADRS